MFRSFSLVLVTAMVLIHAHDAHGQLSEQVFAPYHRVSVVLSHAHIPSAVLDGDKEWLAVPAFGLDYDYWFRRKWAAGVHMDIAIENYLVESDTDDTGMLERESPVVVAGILAFKPGRHLLMLVGAGAELASDGNLFLVRLGAEYGWEVSEAWEVGMSLMYDARWNAYDTWVFGFGVSRLFKNNEK